MPSTIFTPPYPLLEDPELDGVRFDQSDISSDQKRTLGSYLSSLTRGKEPDVDLPPPGGYNGQVPPNHANPYFISEPGEQQRGFMAAAAGSVREAVDLESQPSYLFGDVGRIVDVTPLGQARETTTGSGPEALDGVVGSGPTGKNTLVSTANAKNYVRTLGESLSRKNLNSGEVNVNGEPVSPDSSFLSEDGPETSSRVRLGDSLGKSYDTSNIKRTSGGKGKPADLAEVGRRLMATAMGASATTDEYDNFGKWIDGPSGLKQIDASAVRPTAVETNAKSTLTDLNRTMLSGGQDEISSTDGIGNSDGTYTGKVWPTAYSPDAPFTGFETGQGAFAAFVLGGTFVAAVLAAAALGAVAPIAPASVPAEINSGLKNLRKLRSGQFRYAPREGASAILSAALEGLSDVAGVTLTNPIYTPTNPEVGFGDCVIAGLASFLGVTLGIDLDLIARSPIFTANANTAIQLAAVAARLAVIYADPTSRQYYMTIIRELNRNTVSLGGQLGDFGSAVGAAAASVAGIGSAPSVFDSKIFKFVNTLAKIGDLEYTRTRAIEFRGTDIEADPSGVYDPAGGGFDLKKPARLSTAKGFAARRIYGDRIKDFRGSTLSISDLPSAHLIPNGASQAYRGLMVGNVAERMKAITPSEVDGRIRITNEDVRVIESALDAEYMPFYFHDLRTNEIISFHAFLDDVTDSYTANYNSTSGYGRIENVHQYKDTKRSVACTFHIVGMNPQDFEYMWWQINKLTTMVYPQWSQGRNLQTSDGFKFTQPFSQIPTATPVIRLRIGDLIRSNYSRFNLKRLFGRQDADKIESQTTTTARVVQTSEVASTTRKTGKYLIKAGESYETGVNGVRTRAGTTKLPKVNILDKPVEWFVAQKINDGFYSVEGLPAGVDFGGVFVNEASGLVKPQTISIPGGVNITESETSKINDTTFYDPANNSIVKSFESTAGMGLAAVVTQLGFTWMDALWGVGEDGPGNRAPRSCKVQMSFEPIHDIAPGLDHEGFNRAPIYPVGNLVNGIVEGDEDEPYGAGTARRDLAKDDVGTAKTRYETENKPGFLAKLF